MIRIARAVGQIGRRLGWGVLDQGASSLTNYAMVFFIAKALGVQQFGAFSLAYVTYGFALNASRGLSTDPMMVRFSGADERRWRRTIAHCTGTSIVVGLVTGTLVLAAGIVIGGTTELGFLALGLTLPLLLLQDSWRYAFFAVSRGGHAFLNDAIWGATLLPALFVLRALHHVNVFWCVFAWGATAGIAACVGLIQARVVPNVSGGWAWLVSHRDLGLRFLAENTTNSASVQLRAYAIGFILGLAAVGYVQATQTLMGPFMVIFFGLGLVVMPEATRIVRKSPRRLPRFALLVSSGLAIGAFLWGGALLIALPHGLGDILLGKIWRPAYPLLLPNMIALMGGCFSTGAGVALHALASARRSLRVTIVTATLTAGLSIGGAALGGATGTMWGAAVAGWVGAALFWRQLIFAVREVDKARGRHRLQRGPSGVVDNSLSHAPSTS